MTTGDVFSSAADSSSSDAIFHVLLGLLGFLLLCQVLAGVRALVDKRRRTLPYGAQANWLAKRFDGRTEVLVDQNSTSLPPEYLADVALSYGYVFGRNRRYQRSFGYCHVFVRIFDPSVGGGLVEVPAEDDRRISEGFVGGADVVWIPVRKRSADLLSINTVARRHGYFFQGERVRGSWKGGRREVGFVRADNGAPPLPLPFKLKLLSDKPTVRRY